MTAVLLVFQMGQPRIFFSMARDGLMPPVFARVHPVYQTPHITTIATGLAVGISAAFLDISVVIELCNIGTLFAFVVVCASILLLRFRDGKTDPQPGTPYFKSSIVTLILGALLLLALYPLRDNVKMLIALGTVVPLCLLCGLAFMKLPGCVGRPFNTPFVPLFPVLGILFCLILMVGSPLMTWIRFFVWLAVGLVVYYIYGYHHSQLGKHLSSMDPEDAADQGLTH